MRDSEFCRACRCRNEFGRRRGQATEQGRGDADDGAWNPRAATREAHLLRGASGAVVHVIGHSICDGVLFVAEWANAKVPRRGKPTHRTEKYVPCIGTSCYRCGEEAGSALIMPPEKKRGREKTDLMLYSVYRRLILTHVFVCVVVACMWSGMKMSKQFDSCNCVPYNKNVTPQGAFKLLKAIIAIAFLSVLQEH